MPTRKQYSRWSRRRFLRACGAAGTLAIPMIVPASALGRNGVVAPSERIHLGGIGIRHRGGYVLGFMLQQPDVRFMAVADVRADQRAAVKSMADNRNGDSACATYRDFRELLERDDIKLIL